MALSRIYNQAVELYTPTETLFNDSGAVCSWHYNYFPLVTCDDVTEIVFNSSVEASDIGNDPIFGDESSGTATSAVVNTLTDSGADFDGSGGGTPIINTDMIVRNTTSGVSASVVSVDSATQLTLSADIFPLGTEGYSISYYTTTGDMNIGTNEMVKDVVGGLAGTFTQSGILTEGELYQVELTISSFSSTVDGDQINLIISGETVLTLDETNNVPGTYLISGFAATGTTLDVQVTADAGISATFSTMEVGQLSNATYTVKSCDDDSIVYTSVEADITTSQTTSQIKVSFDWSELMSGYDCPCGCYYIEVTDGTNTFRTNCMQVCDSHSCTVKLSGTNLDNAFGIDFVGLAYTPVVRISAELEAPKYKGDKENEEDSSGVSKTLYFKSEKQQNLFIWQQPEWMHDFLRLLIGYDTFQIDDVNYVAENAGYDTESSRAAGKLPDLSQANVVVRKKTDLNENKFC